MPYRRYAIFYVPTDADFAAFGAAWLGWDIIEGRSAALFPVEGLANATQTPRKYGFHGTVKPPFRLAKPFSQDQLEAAVADIAGQSAAVLCEQLQITQLGRFMALTVHGDAAGLGELAARFVTGLDPFRKPMDETELAKRSKPNLSARQQEMLITWGYPHVLQEFRFHLTLTGKLSKTDVERFRAALDHHMPVLPKPFIIDQLALVGERMDGNFEVIRQYTLR